MERAKLPGWMERMTRAEFIGQPGFVDQSRFPRCYQIEETGFEGSLSLSAARRKEFQGVNWSIPVPLTRRGRSFEDLTSEPTCFRIPPGWDASKETGRLKGVD